MDGFGWIVLAFVAINVIRAIAKGSAEAGKAEPPPAPPRPRPRLSLPKGPPSAPRKQPNSAPARQRPLTEREQWGQVLEQITRAQQGRPGSTSGRQSVPIAGEEEWEEGESLEVGAEVVSLEVAPQRGERALVDYDDQAEALVQKRIKSAQARDSAISRADHKAFDQRIRTPAEQTPVHALPTVDELRKAFVWSEVLGLPVSLRE